VPLPTNITTNETTTEIVVTETTSKFEEPKPQYVIIVMMAMILLGVLTFIIVDIVKPQKQPNEFDEFNYLTERKTDRDDLYGTNRNFLTS
jgi:hypothetical protein